MDELVDQIRTAAEHVGAEHFLELLRWHRAVVGLREFDPHTHGAYREAIAGLGDARAGELLRDLRRASRDPRRHRHGADGKPIFRDGRTLQGRNRSS